MDGFKSLDLFSGIGGFALAAERAGIETAAFCEIDKFPQSVLKYRYPDIPVIDDVRKLTRETFKSATGLDYINIVCGGSPCQNLSVAGKREGLSGRESGLFYEYARIVNELKPKFAVWENVPGALSSNGGRDFESVLCAFTGYSGISFEKWGNAGYFKGRDGFYNVAYRILDSRFFGVPQRRRRVFLVASLGDDSCAEILFEQARLRGDSASGENEEQGIASATERGIGGHPENTVDNTLILTESSATIQSESPTLTASMSKIYNRQTPILFENHAQDSRYRRMDDSPTITSRCGTGGNNLPLVVKQHNHGEVSMSEISPTLNSQSGAGRIPMAVSIAENIINRKDCNGGNGIGALEENCYTLNATSGHMQQAEARVTAFGWLGKCIFLSQGGTENDDTHRKFETTDMREWEFKCPKCGKYQPYKWSNIEWDKNYRDGEGRMDFAKVRSSVRLVCEFCKHEIADSDANRKRLNSSAKFVPQNPNAPTTKAGFHWNSLASMSWGELAEMYLRAKESCRRGDLEDLKNFYQKRLALPWGDLEEDFTLDISPSGYRMGDDWESEGAVGAKGAVLPPPHENKNRVRLRFLTVDVQMDHFYAVVRSWACDASSRLVYCAKLQTWEDVEILQNRFGVFPQLVFVDAGYSTFEVYRNCAKHNWTALMGDGRRDFPHRVNGKITQRFYSTARHPLVSDRKCRMHYWSNLGIKDTLARLRSNQNPDEGSTWEVPSDVPEEYLKMLDSEQRVKNGNSWEWRQIGKRPNHYWDCEAMQVCAAYMMKLFKVD